MSFGNDFSSVQGADLQQQALQQQASEAAMNRFLATMQANRQMDLANRQFDFQTQTAYPQEMAMRGRQLDIEQDLATRRLAAEQDRNKIAQGYLDAYKQQIPQQTSAQMKDSEFAFNSAAQDAERGLFGSPEEVGRYYPQLSDGQRQLMAQRSLSVRPMMEQQYTAGDRAANLLNTYDLAHQTLEDYHFDPNAKEPPIISTTGDPKLVAHDHGIPESAVKKAKWFGDSPDEVQRKADIIRAWTVKNHLEQNGNLQQLRRSAGVAYDPQSGKWSNTVNQPRWMQPGPDLGNGPAVATPQQYSAPAGPAAPAISRQMPTPVMMSQSAPAPAAAAYSPQMPSPFYDRVNQYVNAGMAPAAAKQRAMADWQNALTAGNMP